MRITAPASPRQLDLGIAILRVVTGIIFTALTAVALAGVALTGGRGSLPRVLVGALILATIANGLIIRGIQPYWATVATGALLHVTIPNDGVDLASHEQCRPVLVHVPAEALRVLPKTL